MINRDVLLVTHGSLHPALRRELARRGLELRESRTWVGADTGEARRILGAYTWFYEGMRHPVDVWRMHRWLRGNGIPLFAWNQDAPNYLNRSKWRLDWFDRMHWLDVYATHTLIDQRRFANSWMYFPNAADIERYNLAGRSLAELRNPAQYEFDVSFFGAMDGTRYKEMKGRQEFFAALGARLSERGIRYVFREATGMSVAEQVALVQATRINLNFGASCDYGSAIASGLPERCYGIPACGGFLLCDRRTHSRDDFLPGSDWAEFDGLDDCVVQIEYWLGRFDACRDLAERTHDAVVARHTYAHRAATLHEALLDWHSGRRGQLR